MQRSQGDQPAREPVFSVLDLGTVAVKALVVSDEGRVLGFGAAQRNAGATGAQLVGAAERSLVEAEDRAGQVPRRVVVGVAAGDTTIAGSAREAAHALAAQRGEAPRVSAVHDGLFAVEAALAGLTALVDTLDLDLGGLIAEPRAIEALAGAEPAVVLDVGGGTTAVTLCGDGGAIATLSAPIGGATLEARVAEQLGVSPAQARDAVLAHSAGAGGRSSAGRAAGPVVAKLARHHADVWLDALETMLEEMARGAQLPARLVLCGGGAALPELRQALAGSALWAALAFRAAPRVEVTVASDVRGIEGVEELGLNSSAVMGLAIAATVLGRR